MKRHFFLFFSILLVFNVHSSNVLFHSINEKFGLSMLNVSSVCKDNKGFVWASSRSGVMRLTDDSYHIYSLPFEKHNAIVVQLIHKNSELLAYANNGQIFRYNDILDRFDTLVIIRKFNIGVAKIEADNKGAYWIGTNSGLYKYYKGALSLQLSDVDIRDIAWYNQNQLIIATNHKIILLDVNTLKGETIYEYNSSQPFEISQLFYDKLRSKLWVGTISDGLCYYNFTTHFFSKTSIKNFPKQPILAIESNSDSTMLIGADGHGILKVDSRFDKLLGVYLENGDDPSSLPSNGVYDIYSDK